MNATQASVEVEGHWLFARGWQGKEVFPIFYSTKFNQTQGTQQQSSVQGKLRMNEAAVQLQVIKASKQQQL